MKSGRVDLSKLTEPTPDPGHYQKPISTDPFEAGNETRGKRPTAVFASKTVRPGPDKSASGNAAATLAVTQPGPGSYNTTKVSSFKKKVCERARQHTCCCVNGV